eukprot:CAMPEP_0172466728 /NCGR_PEP_ID=MMETSP1065-20121228/56999_1 /TAXON_ID=265537 /ORGANISM="Amphiprora paludosa, Strain CCMP125" /LENGTH=96 /DNA_ID=CAMNT_0013223629 /DNA_START=26 /DNA_END=312 /DNA_ORIENTATION=+
MTRRLSSNAIGLAWLMGAVMNLHNSDAFILRDSCFSVQPPPPAAATTRTTWNQRRFAPIHHSRHPTTVPLPATPAPEHHRATHPTFEAQPVHVSSA